MEKDIGLSMLSLRKAQIQLQSHRIWLNAFKTGFSLQPRTASRAFTCTSQHERELKISRGRSTAKQRKKERWEGRRTDRTKDVHLGALGDRQDLLEAVKEQKTKDIIRLYQQLPDKRPLAEKDFGAIAQWMHQALRLENQKRERKETTRREDTDEIVAFTKQLVSDIKHGNIVPSRSAHVHMIGIFKESSTMDAGKNFWIWLEKQDSSHVSIDTYAAAVEMLAFAGSPLQELEGMYQRALVRFPGDFHSYHLSPNAILADRDQHPPIRSLPFGLLQAITTARLLRGDSRNAYLALDTALRLFPTTASQRFFNIFLKERPVSEAYTVFAMACRAGYKVPLKVFRGLIEDLRDSFAFKTVGSHIATLRAILSALYLHVGSSGSVISNPVASFVITCAETFRFPGFERLDAKQRKKLVDAALIIFRKAFEIFARYGVLPPQQAFNSIIFNVAGCGRSKEVLGIVMKDLKALGLEPNDITRRSVLAVAGRWQDPEMVEKTWQEIVQAKRDRGEWPDRVDFTVLIKSAKHAGNLSFAEKQFDALQTFLPEWQRLGVVNKMESVKVLPDVEERSITFEFDELLAGLQRVQADLDAIDLHTRDLPAVQNFSSQSLPMMLLDPTELGLSSCDEDLRKIYDEMSTDSSPQQSVETSPIGGNDVSSPGTVTAKEATRSATNIPFGELRYENWKCINYLLKLSELHDAEYGRTVDSAIAAGTRPPPRDTAFSEQDVSLINHDIGVAGSEKKAKDKKAKSEKVRNDIMRLRGRTGA